MSGEKSTSDETTVTVDLGEQSQALEERMATGRYASPSEVVQEAMQALEREDALIEELVDENMEDAGLGPAAADPAEARRPTDPEA